MERAAIARGDVAVGVQRRNRTVKAAARSRGRRGVDRKVSRRGSVHTDGARADDGAAVDIGARDRVAGRRLQRGVERAYSAAQRGSSGQDRGRVAAGEMDWSSIAGHRVAVGVLCRDCKRESGASGGAGRRADCQSAWPPPASLIVAPLLPVIAPFAVSVAVTV